MSEQYEQSYYEIALTGRQVLVAFVILLVCLVAAFFSGLWVGRGALEEAGEPAVVAEDAAEAAPGVEELSFFEDPPPQPARELPEVAARPSPETTLAEDVGASDPADPPEPAGSPGEEGARAADDRTAEASPGAAPDRSQPAAGAGLPSSGDLVIQVFSSAEEAKAREVLDRIERAGFRVFLSPVADGGRTLYRVRVGPFERRAQAEATARRLREALNLETWITQ